MNKSIIYKAQGDKDIQSDLDKLKALQKENESRCRMSKCSCEAKEHIQIGYQVIGYGRSTQTVIDLENAEIKHYYSHACDQNTVNIMKILFCPFCGKKLKGGAE